MAGADNDYVEMFREVQIFEIFPFAVFGSLRFLAFILATRQMG